MKTGKGRVPSCGSFLLFNLNVRGTPAAGFCSGVKVCEKFSPILIVVVGVIKFGQVKVNCTVEIEITTFTVSNTGYPTIP